MKKITLHRLSSFLFLLLLALPLGGCPNLDALLRLYGFTSLKPPSTILAPGAMVYIQGDRPFTAGLVCTQQDSLGSSFRPLQGPTTTSVLRQATEHEYALGPEYLNVFKADSRFSDIQDITARLSNAVIYTISDVDVMQNIGNRDPLCKQAIQARRAAGFKITMISSVLKADVIYSVNFKQQARLNSQEKISLMQYMAASFGFNSVNVTESTVSGDNLVWGIIDDTFLAGLPYVHNSSGRLLSPEDIGQVNIPTLSLH